MVPERASGFLRHFHGLRRPAGHVSPAAAGALFTATALVWLLTVQPASSIPLWKMGPGTPVTHEQWVVMLASAVGVFALLSGLFAMAVYVVHWPAVQNREARQMIVQARAELAELQRTQARLFEKLASLRQLRSQIAMYETQLMHARPRAAQDAGRVVGNGLELVDDIISELQAAGARSDRTDGDWSPW